MGKTTIPVINMIIAASVKVGLNWTLTALPWMGIKGAAWATVADIGIAALLNLVFIYRHTGFSLPIIGVVKTMGEIWAEGQEAFAFLQTLVTNDLTDLEVGQSRYSPMCYKDGGTVDDLLIYKFGPEKYLIVVNAANIEKDWNWMQENIGSLKVELVNKSDATGQLALQGPKALEILEKLTSAPVGNIGYYHFMADVMVAGKNTIVSRTGYTGEDGFEIYCEASDAPVLWEAIMLLLIFVSVSTVVKLAVNTKP